jgi:organic hydroperoxide reductase OsmC/OhrA
MDLTPFALLGTHEYRSGHDHQEGMGSLEGRNQGRRRHDLDRDRRVEGSALREGGKGTNPEELIGAAHAGCFSMALSLMLGQARLEA